MRPFGSLNQRIPSRIASACLTAKAVAIAIATALTLSVQATAAEAEDIGMLLQSGSYQEALDRIDALPQESRAQPQMRLYHGMALMALDRRSDAMRSFEALAAEHPEMPEPFNNMAVLQAANGRYGDARVLLEQALRADARYSVALENIGDVYIKLANQTYARLRTLQPARKSARKRHEAVQLISRVIDRPGSTK